MHLFLRVCTVAMALVILGCRSTRPTAAGGLSYEQAVASYGAPDSILTHTDGSRTAEWFTKGKSGVPVWFGLNPSAEMVPLGTVGGRKPTRIEFEPNGVARRIEVLK